MALQGQEFLLPLWSCGQLGEVVHKGVWVRVCMHPPVNVCVCVCSHRVLMQLSACVGPCECPHRSLLCGVVAAPQQPRSTLQCTASVSPSHLSSADRTQLSPEIQLIGWRFFIALYWSDGWEGLAGVREAGSRVLCC